MEGDARTVLMNMEDVLNHDRRLRGDPPRKLTCLAGSHEVVRRNTKDTRIGVLTYVSLM